MCVEIHLQPSEQEVGTLGELRSLVGTKNLKYYPGMKGNYDSDEQCLCGIDIDFTLQLAGYDVSWPDHRMHCDATKKSSELTEREKQDQAYAKCKAVDDLLTGFVDYVMHKYVEEIDYCKTGVHDSNLYAAIGEYTQVLKEKGKL